MPSRASRTGGGPCEGIAKLSWLSTSPRRSTPLRSRKRAGQEKSGFSRTLKNSPLPIGRTIKRLALRKEVQALYCIASVKITAARTSPRLRQRAA